MRITDSYMELRTTIIEQIITRLKTSIQELEETLQSEKASLYGETKSSAGDKYETQREMIQGEIQRTKSQWSLKNEQLESLYGIIAWEQQAIEKLSNSSSNSISSESAENHSNHPFSIIRNGSIVQLIPAIAAPNSNSKMAGNNTTPSHPPKNHPPKENDRTSINSDGMWLFIGVSLGDIKIGLPIESDSSKMPEHSNASDITDSKSTHTYTTSYNFKTLTIESPLGKVLLGKKSGETFALNGKSFLVLNCF